MADEEKKPSRLTMIREYFEIKQLDELKALTDEDKAQLAQGLEDGSLNY